MVSATNANQFNAYAKIILMKKALIIILSLVILIGLGVGIFMLADSKDSPSSPENNNTNQGISSADLKMNNGLDGKPCWVAVDGAVYLVPEGTKDWKDGEHTKSGGRVKCGMNTGSVITSSPHGDKVLADLQKIGNLQ